MPINMSKLPPPPPEPEGPLAATWRMVTHPITETLGLNPAIDKWAEPGLDTSVGGARLKGFLAGAAEAIKPEHVAAVAALPAMAGGEAAADAGLISRFFGSKIPGTGAIPGVARLAAIAPKIPRIGQAAVAAQGAIGGAESVKKGYEDINDPTKSKTDVALDTVNAGLGALGAVQGVKGFRIASKEANAAYGARQATQAVIENQFKSLQNDIAAKDPTTLDKLLKEKYPELGAEVDKNPGGKRAKDIYGPKGKPAPLSIAEQNVQNVKDAIAVPKAEAQAVKLNNAEAASDIQIEEERVKGIAKDRAAQIKEINQGFKDSADATKGLDKATAAAEKGLSTQFKNAVNAKNARMDKFEKNRRTIEIARAGADAEDLKRTQAAQQQQDIQDFLNREDVKASQKSASQTSKGVGPNGESRTLRESFHVVPPKPGTPPVSEGGVTPGGEGGLDGAPPQLEGAPPQGSPIKPNMLNSPLGPEPDVFWNKRAAENAADKLGGPSKMQTIRLKDGTYRIAPKDAISTASDTGVPPDVNPAPERPFDPRVISGKLYPRNRAQAISDLIPGSEINQVRPGKWEVRPGPNYVHPDAVPSVEPEVPPEPSEPPPLTPLQRYDAGLGPAPPSRVAPYVPDSSAPVVPGYVKKGMTKEEFHRMMDLQPVMNGKRLAPEDEAEYRSLIRRYNGPDVDPDSFDPVALEAESQAAPPPAKPMGMQGHLPNEEGLLADVNRERAAQGRAPVSNMMDAVADDGKFEAVRMPGDNPPDTPPIERLPPGSAEGAENSWPQKASSKFRRGRSLFDTFPNATAFNKVGQPAQTPSLNPEVNSLPTSTGLRVAGEPPVEPEGPQFAATKSGGLKIGQNIERSASELTTGYSKPLEGIMMREAMQNAIDAVRHLGWNGKISAKVMGDGFTISDNGRGMNRKQLQTVFSDLYESGKTSESGATGGKGIGKATYMLGGKYFKAETVTIQNGNKVKFTIEGSPEQFRVNVPITEQIMPLDTPTGTTIHTDFRPGMDDWEAHKMLSNVVRHSRGVQSDVETDTGYGLNSDKFASLSDDNVIAKDTIDGNGITLSVPKAAQFKEQNHIDVEYLNNGMYQFSRRQYLDKNTDLPNTIILDIAPSAEEGTIKYPFPTQRESIKTDLQNSVDKFIHDKLIDPRQQSKKHQLDLLYKSMTEIPTTGASGRKGVFFDPGERLTPAEHSYFSNSSVIKKLIAHYDSTINDILQSAGHQKWIDRVEKTGMVLDPGMHGVHIPNPINDKSTILVNPFEWMASGASPEEAAFNGTVTQLHEVAHVAVGEQSYPAKMSNWDINDPRVGKYLQSYLQTIQDHGGLQGHSVPFIKQLGEVYATYGPDKFFNSADKIQSILTDESGGYSPEAKELLRIYSESRGRPEVTTDFLSGTGVKSEIKGPGKGNLSGNNRPDRVGASPGLFDEPGQPKAGLRVGDSSSISDFANALKKEGERPIAPISMPSSKVAGNASQPIGTTGNLFEPPPPQKGQAGLFDPPAPPVKTSPLLELAKKAKASMSSKLGAIPVRSVQDVAKELESADTEYGNIKAAKEAGRYIPETVRQASGEDLQRLRKEHTALTGPPPQAAPKALSESEQTVKDVQAQLADPKVPQGTKERLKKWLANFVAENNIKLFPGDKGGGSTLSSLGAGQGANVKKALSNNPEFGSRLALGGIGGVIGYNTDDDNPMRGAAIGAGLGLGVPSAVTKAGAHFPTAFDKLNRLHNTALLSPISVGKKLVADIQGLAQAAIENPDKRGNILRQFTTPEGRALIAHNFKEGYNGPETEMESLAGLDNFIQNKKNPLSISGRTMGGLTHATKGILGESGFTDPEQRYWTLTDYPRTALGEGVYNLLRTNKALQHLSPFARIGVNRLERGVEYSPLAMFSKAMHDPATRAEALKKMAMGTGAMAATYKATPEDFYKEHPIVAGTMAAGPMGLPLMAAMAMKTAKKKDVPGTGIESRLLEAAGHMSDASQAVGRDVPGLRLMEDLTGRSFPIGFARNYLSGYTNVTRPIANGIDLLKGEQDNADLSSKNLPLSGKLFNRMKDNVPILRGTLPQKGGAPEFGFKPGSKEDLKFDPVVYFKDKRK